MESEDRQNRRVEKLLSDAAVSGQGVGEVFLQINRFLAQQPERKQAYELIRALAKPYPANPGSPRISKRRGRQPPNGSAVLGAQSAR